MFSWELRSFINITYMQWLSRVHNPHECGTPSGRQRFWHMGCVTPKIKSSGWWVDAWTGVGRPQSPFPRGSTCNVIPFGSFQVAVWGTGKSIHFVPFSVDQKDHYRSSAKRCREEVKGMPCSIILVQLIAVLVWAQLSDLWVTYWSSCVLPRAPKNLLNIFHAGQASAGLTLWIRFGYARLN